MAFNPYKNFLTLKRFNQIAATMIRFGFGGLFGRLNLLGRLRLRRQATEVPPATQSRAVRFRQMLEQLGPTAVKLGQVLSTRPDLLPPDIIAELANLQDHVTATPWEQMRPFLRKHLGDGFERRFAEFDTQPLASASIAQVYRGRLHSGETVAVKILRPHTEEIFREDLNILEYLSNLVQTHITEARNWDVEGIVAQFRASVSYELDLRHEGRNAEIFRSHFGRDQTLYVPKIHWEYTNRYVLVMEYIEGESIDACFGAGCDAETRKLLARRAADVVLRQIYEHGFFHADPHPGNIFVLPDNKLCFLDFGMFGRLDEESLSVFARALHAIVKKDAERLVKAARELGLVPEHVNEFELRLNVLDILEQYHGLPLKQISVPKLFRDILALVSRFRLQVRPDFMFLIKALSTIENTVRQLDADFDLISHTEPFVRRLYLQRYRPDRVFGQGYRFAEDVAQLTQESPEHVLEIMRKVRQGKLKLELQHEGFEDPIAQLNAMSDKVVLGIIIGGLTIASSVMAHSGVGPSLFGYPVIGGLGFLIAGVAGIVTVYDILRSRRRR